MDKESEEQSTAPSHPPPPCDPFQRYQTPWPRHRHDDENPFIRFRRFTDEQFKSFFSGIPFVKSSVDGHFESLAAQHREEMDAAFKQMIEENYQRLVRDIDQLRSQKSSENAAPMSSIEQTSRQIPEAAQNIASNQPTTELDMYERPGVEELDPFANKEDTYPWLLSSQYSPIWLSSQFKPRSEARPERSSLGIAYHNAVRLNTESEDSAAISPWRRAFEDLLELECTGQMREHRLDNSWPAHPAVWLAGLFRQGLLSQPQDPTSHRSALVTFWGPLVSALGTAELARRHLELTDIFHHQPVFSDHDRNDNDDYDYDYDDDDEEEQLDTSTASMVTAELESKPIVRTLAHALEAVERTFEEIMGSTQRASDPGSPSSQSYDSQPSIISTMTRTETRTLPDGSIETRRVLRRRFADGKEEHEESVGTEPAARPLPPRNTDSHALAFPPIAMADKQTQTPHPLESARGSMTSSEPEEQSRGGGWFWR